MPSSKSADAGAATVKWLSVVGIGEDGLAGIGAAARVAIEAAEVVFGGKRHLSLSSAAIRGEARPWPVPFDAAMGAVVALRGRRVCVLASGDPFFHGVGVTLARHVSASEVDVFPAPSAFSLAAARLGWALQDIETVSLHGRPLSLLRPLLSDGARILALTSDGNSPAAVAALLTRHGFGRSRVHVLEALGGDGESVHAFSADELAGHAFADLNVVAIEAKAGAAAAVVPLAGALDYASGFGVSQDGRLLRHFLWLGLNLDEEGRRVFDGLMPHVGGSSKENLLRIGDNVVDILKKWKR